MNIDKITDTYRTVARCPNVVKGALVPNGSGKYVLESNWQQRDLEREENVKFVKWASLDIQDERIKIGIRIPSNETSGELLSRYSSNGDRKAIVREVTNKEKKKIQYLEVWDKSKKRININLKELDKHGDVHNNSQFGSLEWSTDGSKLLYIAEAKTPKTESFFKNGSKKEQQGDSRSKKEECQPGNEHIFKESWGEQLVECHRPTVCVLDVVSQDISVHSDVIPSDISAGQAIWFQESIIFVGWKNEPYRLGLRMCMIRANSLYLLDRKAKTCKMLTNGNRSVFCPRLHPTKDCVYFLENPLGGPHLNCNKLMSLDLPTGDIIPECKVVVNVVESAKNHDFPGLFVLDLPQNCWDSEGKYLFATSAWRSHKCLLAIDISSGNVKRLTLEGDVGVLDVRDDVVVISHSTPSSPPKIKVGKFDGSCVTKWEVVEQPSEDFTDIKWSVHEFEPEMKNPDYPDVNCDYILLQPAGGTVHQNGPLIINPHGGPHSHNYTTFALEIAGLCLLGFTVVQVNYRGSIGFGKDSIHSLPGRAGTQDVADVQQVARDVKKNLGFERVYVSGGSHGGFISLHLISQFPDFYSAACVRNPAVNLVSKVGVSDIPDWNYCTAGVAEFSHDSIPTAEGYAKMLKMSPITHVAKAKAPCMVAIGDLDLRVPPSQGKQWVKLYKALGKKCKLFEYKGNSHPLNKVDAEADRFVNMVLWFEEHQDSLS